MARLACLAILDALPCARWTIKAVIGAFFNAVAYFGLNGPRWTEVALRAVINIDEARPCALTVAAKGTGLRMSGAGWAEIACRAGD